MVQLFGYFVRHVLRLRVEPQHFLKRGFLLQNLTAMSDTSST